LYSCSWEGLWEGDFWIWLRGTDKALEELRWRSVGD
jgi:hypothetical protein